MANLLNAVTADDESAGVAATGPIIITRTGKLGGQVRITADIGGGEVTIATMRNFTTRVIRLEIGSGVTFKAYAENLVAGDEVTVDYVFV